VETKTPERLLAARAVRDRLGGVSDMTLWRWVRDGVLPAPSKIRHRNYWSEAAVTAVVHGAAPKVKA